MLTKFTSVSASDPVEQESEKFSGAPELAVIVPVFNEVKNVALVIQAVEEVLSNISWELIFVDDNSPDGTVERVHALAKRDVRVRCLRRLKRRGLSGAVIEGMMSSSACYLAAMDGDLQHDHTALTQMLDKVRNGADLVVGTRYALGGSSQEGFTKVRSVGSKLATLVAKRFLRLEVSDPMSGFFILRRDVANEIAPHLSTYGFKILTDILISSPRPLKIEEVTYNFRDRRHGESKLDSLVVWDYLTLLTSKLAGGVIPPRFITFALVGSSGLVVHLVALKLVLSHTSFDFSLAQFSAALIAMISNFTLNNLLTYRDRRLRGFKILTGLLMFCVVCSIGAVANIGVATWIYANQPIWWFAGLSGALMGAIFNYAVNSTLTWRES